MSFFKRMWQSIKNFFRRPMVQKVTERVISGVITIAIIAIIL